MCSFFFHVLNDEIFSHVFPSPLGSLFVVITVNTFENYICTINIQNESYRTLGPAMSCEQLNQHRSFRGQHKMFAYRFYLFRFWMCSVAMAGILSRYIVVRLWSLNRQWYVEEQAVGHILSLRAINIRSIVLNGVRASKGSSIYPLGDAADCKELSSCALRKSRWTVLDWHSVTHSISPKCYSLNMIIFLEHSSAIPL